MPSAAARKLSAAHRDTQRRIGVQTIEALRAVWRLLDPDDLDGSFAAWLIAVLPVIETKRSTSARVAAAYLATFKELEVGKPAKPVLAVDPPARAVATSMLVTGPLSVKRNVARGVPLGRAMSTAQAASAAAAMRHVLNGGRDTISATIQADRDAQGYARVASSNACSYCAGLEGITFPDDTVFAAHDGCSCSSEPVYR